MKLFQRTTTWLGGMNTLLEPADIPPDAVRLLMNGVIDLSGYVRARDGCFNRGSPEDLPTEARGLVPYYLPEGASGVLGVYPSGIYRNIGGGTWDAVATTGFSLVAGLHAGVVGRRADGKGTVYLFSVEPASGASVPYSGLCWVRPGGELSDASQRSDFAPGTALFWQGRLWAADVASYPSDTLFWSTLWDGGDFSAAAENQVRVDPFQGGRITALVAARGDVPQLYVFKDNAIYLLDVQWNTDGVLPVSANTLDTTKAALRPLNYRVGCVAPRSAVWVPSSIGGDAFFLAADGVRSLRRTQEDAPQGGGGLPISVTITDWISRITWAHARNATATVHDNCYYLAVPLDGARLPTHVFVKNLLSPLEQGWSIWDLRARTVTATDEPSPRLLFQSAVATGESAATAVRVYEISKEAPNVDPGSLPISFDVETRGYDMRGARRGGDGVRKIWRWAELHYDVDESGVSVVASVAIDGQDNFWTLPPFFVQYAAATVRLPAALPWIFGAGSTRTHKIGLEGIPPGFSLQFRFHSDGPGVFRLRRLEVVAQAVSKEWE